MDKSLILRDIKKYLGFKKDSDFAEFLGIKQNTLSNWKTRNTIDYDLIISKCEKIDANWLLTGKGTMFKENTPTAPPPEDTGQIALLQQENAFLKEKIHLLEENKALLLKQIQNLEKDKNK